MFKKIFLSIKSHMFTAFIPWIFFAVFYGNTKQSILMGSIGSLILMGVFNFRELVRGFILPWGSVILFVFLAVNGLFDFVKISPIGSFRLINSALAVIVIFSLLIGKPFTLQYARE